MATKPPQGQAATAAVRMPRALEAATAAMKMPQAQAVTAAMEMPLTHEEAAMPVMGKLLAHAEATMAAMETAPRAK